MKTFVRNLVGAAIAAAVFASAADAAVLATPPAANYYPIFGGRMTCNLLNVGPNAASYQIDIIDYGGSILASTGQLVANPLAMVTLSDNTFGAYCRFTVSGGKKKWRGVALYDDGADYTTSVIAR